MVRPPDLHIAMTASRWGCRPRPTGAGSRVLPMHDTQWINGAPLSDRTTHRTIYSRGVPAAWALWYRSVQNTQLLVKGFRFLSPGFKALLTLPAMVQIYT